MFALSFFILFFVIGCTLRVFVTNRDTASAVIIFITIGWAFIFGPWAIATAIELLLGYFSVDKLISINKAIKETPKKNKKEKKEKSQDKAEGSMIFNYSLVSFILTWFSWFSIVKEDDFNWWTISFAILFILLLIREIRKIFVSGYGKW